MYLGVFSHIGLVCISVTLALDQHIHTCTSHCLLADLVAKALDYAPSP